MILRKNTRFLARSVLFLLVLSMSMAGAQQSQAGAQVGAMTNDSDIMSAIRTDYARIMALAYQAENLNSAKNNASADQVANQMVALASAHMMAEEQVFYPALARV